jgi:hypothetical protein
MQRYFAEDWQNRMELTFNHFSLKKAYGMQMD